jgi:hypothetical protein
MSAAATAAGYLYASGRLRGRNLREGEEAKKEDAPAEKPRARRREVKVAVVEPAREPEERSAPSRPRSTPKIQYRTRRWKPE